MEFQTKQKSLFSKKKQPVPTEANAFVKAGLKESNTTTSGNGAKKYSTSNDPFVDQFAAIASYREPREYAVVSNDMYRLWSINPKQAVQLAIYIRMITRDTQVVVPGKEAETLEGQKGQGLKNEGIMRMLWLARHHSETFKANFPYFIAAGSWKDVFTMLVMDLTYNGIRFRKLDWNYMMQTILAGLANSNTSELVKKYLPTIKSAKDCTTVEAEAKNFIGITIAELLYGKPKDKEDHSNRRRYRKMKNSGTAHKWQQLISQKNLIELDFGTIHGRALSLLVGSKFLKNQGLTDKYRQWISTKATAKYTGFVFELFAPLGEGHYAHMLPDYQEMTINAQFNQLIETAKVGMNRESTLLVVRDISGSMTSTATGTNMSSYAIGKAMALYFSSLLSGPFANAYASFSNTCLLRTWTGNTPVEKWRNDTDSNFGSTNLQSVAALFVKLLKDGKIPENEFPTGILCISDGEFNRTGQLTNFEAFRVALLRAGFSEEYVSNFKLILWDLPNGYYSSKSKPKFEDFADAPNNFYISGYDPSSISFILGQKEYKASPRNARELFLAAMDQDLLNRLEIVKDVKPAYRKPQVKK